MLPYIALGGALGAVARYLVNSKITQALGVTFPYGTLFINISGGLLMGIAIALLAKSSHATPELRAFLMVGVLGGYTTFSAFSLETVMLLERGAWLPAFSYVMASVALSVAAVWLGMKLGHL